MGNGVLATALETAVPLHINRVRDLSYPERQRIAMEAGGVIGGQGDTLMFGGRYEFGHGAKETAAHAAAGKCPGTGEHCACAQVTDPDTRQRRQAACTRCVNPKCYCHIRGEASWSAGEVFNFLARGLAVLACQPGGVTFAGLHWCAYSHPRCPASPGQSPGCSCPHPSWRENGCHQAIDGRCGTDEVNPRA